MANPPIRLTPSSYPAIAIATYGDPGSFADVVNAALREMASRPMGRMLLSSIELDGPAPPANANGVKVTIRDAARFAGRSNVSIRTNEAHGCWQLSQGAPTEGPGTFSIIHWDPNIQQTPDGVRPPFIGLAHELIHARRNLLGIGYLNDNKTEELHTVGLSLLGSPGGVTRNDRRRLGAITENDIRAEHGVEPRMKYSFPDGAITDEFEYLAGFF
jgi:hypothetical protein